MQSPGAAGSIHLRVPSDVTLGPGLCTAKQGVGKQQAVLHETILQSVLLLEAAIGREHAADADKRRASPANA